MSRSSRATAVEPVARLLLRIFILASVASRRPQLVASQEQPQVPTPVQSASYISLDGLTLVVVFSRPVNLSASIESVEQRQAAAAAAAYESTAGDEAAASAQLRLASQSRFSASGNQTNASSEGQKQSPATRRRLQASRVTPSWRPDLTRAASSRLVRTQSRPSSGQSRASRSAAGQCRDLDIGADEAAESQASPHLVGGVQLCAQLLTRKTLKLLHKFKLHNCLWASHVQFLVQLNKPIAATGQPEHQQAVRVAFRRNTLAGLQSQPPAKFNDQEVAVELSKLPLEGLGVPLAPRVALTGPNQVPPCGQFIISAHLSSPYGTQPEESVRLLWSVERLGIMAAGSGNSSGASSSNNSAGGSMAALGQPELVELQWQTLRRLVASQRGNNLVLDAKLLQFAPQHYEFKLTATFAAGPTNFNLNASHQVGRLDFDAPIGTIYGTHMLALDQNLNTNQQLVLMADIQVPECTQNIKQVGLYWQVSDPRVRFEQTYAPVYLAKSNALPEQALIEFRLNLFYGIRVKKFASASALVPTGDSVLDARISDGLLMATVGQQQDLISSSNDQSRASSAGSAEASNQHLELHAVSRTQDQSQEQQQDKYSYLWSCFDGKTAQPCYKSLKLQASSGGTRYDVGSPGLGAARPSSPVRPNSQAASPLDQTQTLAGSAGGPNAASSNSNLLLVDKTRQRQPILKLPLSWFEADAQLWFGLQRFDRQNPSQHSKTEYALISVQPMQPGPDAPSAGQGDGQLPAPVVSIGPVLVGRARQRATIRNPLTGAIVLVAGAPATLVGRLSPAKQVVSFAWRLPNYPHPLHWTTKNVSNPLNGQDEILTELHLNPEQMLAHAQHRVQLVMCSAQAGSRSLATINLDVVQGVGQCSVQLVAGESAGSPRPATANSNLPLMVSVNYCNIPLGLSPVSYQLYIVDTSASDGPIESSRPQQPQPDDDYMNEADEIYFEGQAQPLSVPQLSPVFNLGALNALALVGLVQAQQTSGRQRGPSVRFRFAARVCDRLQSCRLFYSNPIDPLALVTVGPGGRNESSPGASQSPDLIGGPASERLRVLPGAQGSQLASQANSHAVQALRGMLEGAKRANTAGNSVAAISILNALMTLGQRMLQQAAPAKTNSDPGRRQPSSGVSYSRDDADNSAPNGATSPPDEPATGAGKGRPPLGEDELERLRDLLQAAMRDCLHYGAQSLQRHFHYTESGQTNLVLVAMSRILASQQAGFEFKFRAMRLIVLLVRKSLAGSSELKLMSAPDLKSVQVAYESLFGAFSQHSTAAVLASPVAEGATGQSGRAKRALRGFDAGRDPRAILSGGAPSSLPGSLAAPRGSEQPREQQKQQTLRPEPPPRELASEAATATGAAAAPPHQNLHQPQHSSSLKVNRRNKEEAVVAYLRLARQAHKSILQAVAIQLPLGAVQQLEFQSAGSGPLAQQSHQPPAATAATSFVQVVPKEDENNNNVASAASRFLAASKPPAYIVSSLVHQTDLPPDSLDVDLRDFGSVALKFASSKLLALGQQMRQSSLRCRNDTHTRCSSFVLALTTYAGKAPFRSLDGQAAAGAGGLRAAQLRVPIVQVDWLSPVDGSNLVELLRAPSEPSPTDLDQLTPADFRATVTFTLPAQQQGGSGDLTADGAGRYRCYQFDEAANEWAPLQPGDSTDERVPVAEGEASAATAAESNEFVRRLRCSFDGFGAVSAFQGKPPPVESSAELSIVLGVACVFSVVAIFSLLGCAASNTKAKHGRRGNQSDESLGSSKASERGQSYESSDIDADGDRHIQRPQRLQHQQRPRLPVHLEHSAPLH